MTNKRTKTSDPEIVLYPSGMFYFRRGNKEISLKTKDFKQAQRNKKVIASRQDVFLSASLRLKVRDLKSDYIKSRERDLKSGKIRKSTLKESVDLFENYIEPFFGKKSISKVDSLLWEDFKAKTHVRDLTNIRKVFSHFLKWCAKNGYRQSIPILEINSVKRRKRRILKPREIELIWNNSEGSLRLFIALALSMGLRRTEIMTLEWSRVDLVERSVFLPESITKTKRERWVPISQVAHKLLQERLADQVTSKLKTKWVFPNREDRKRHADKGGLRTSWRTCLKHAFNIKDGQPLPDIQWNDMRATCEFYAHKRTDISATQLEKFFGSSVDVQRKIYVSMDADDVRGLEDSLSLPRLSDSMGKSRGNKK